ncbi:MAG: spondin domain-containing protein [Anaerolineales bacterium]
MQKKLLTLGFVTLLAVGACGTNTADPEVASSGDEMMSEEEIMEGDDDNVESEEMASDESMEEGETSDDEMMEDAMVPHAEFTVKLENISEDETIFLAPGAWVVFSEGEPIFTAWESDRGQGLEALAEDGDPSGLGASLGEYMGVIETGVFNTPIDASDPGPLAPGGEYAFEFHAEAGNRFAFATMFVQSNDLFYAPDGGGIALFNEEGMPIGGDITKFISLWDAGTEVNQTPGEGADQAPRQSGPDTGEDEMGVVGLVDDGFVYAQNVLRVTINTMP